MTPWCNGQQKYVLQFSRHIQVRARDVMLYKEFYKVQ